MLKGIGSLMLLMSLTGCVSYTQFSKSMQKPVEAAKAAQAVSLEAANDAERLVLLGVTPGSAASLADKVCAAPRGAAMVASQLGAFGSAMDKIKEVSDPSTDLSYAGYVAQFRKNAENILPPLLPTEVGAAPNTALQRCASLFSSDLAASVKLADAPVFPGGASEGDKAHMVMFGAVKTVAAFDALFKAILKQVEQAHRGYAVQATVNRLLPGLREMHAGLGAARSPAFGTYVEYPGDDSPASRIGRTNLGAVVSLRRFMLAQTIKAQVAVLQGCQRIDCMGDPQVRKNLDDLLANMAAYRGLAQVDTNAILDSLGKALDKVELANNEAKPINLLDGMADVATAIAGIDGKYADYKKAGE